MRAQLLGPSGDGQGGLVAELLDDVLRNAERPARAPYKTTEPWRALLRAMAHALGLALWHWRPEDTATELEPLRAFLRERFVSQQLLLLLRPQADSRWDLPHLLEEMQASGLDATRLGQPDGASWLGLLAEGFYQGVLSEPVLHELISPQALRQLVERIPPRARLATGQSDPRELRLMQTEALYRKTVRGLFERLTFKGMTQTGPAASLRLEEIYVDLEIVAEVPGAADDSSAAERRLLQDAELQGSLDDEQDRELDSLRYRRWRAEARSGQARIARKGLEAAWAGPETHAMVILGDPGSGKTTLLHYLACKAAQERPGGIATRVERLIREGDLPIFIPLAAYDDYLRGNPGTTLEQFLSLYYEKWKNLPGLEPLFLRALEEGRALVLLDGLDEVLKLTPRKYVAQQVRSLIDRWEDRGNRFVMTSRFIGYREVQLANIPHFMVVDFQQDEIALFAHKWCEAYEVWVAEGQRSELVLARARKAEQDLLADVSSKHSVAHLASNPLLLTMLALLRRQVVQLPARRIELYDRYVRMLLEHWQFHRSEGARQQEQERLELHVARQHLEDLALWLQQNRPSGTARERDIVQAMTELALRREDKAPEQATPREWAAAESEAVRCFREVRDIAGLIGERGQDAYGFLHLTFQEYLVGRALARVPPERRWELLEPYLHDPRWHEAILLCAGELGVIGTQEGMVPDLVSRILEAGSEHEEVLHRDLFLAAAVIADDVTRSKKVLGELLARLDGLWQVPVRSIRRQAFEALAQLVRLGHEPAQEKLLRLVEESPHLVELLRAIASVTRDGLSPELREKLLIRLQDPKPQVRVAAVKALGPEVVREEGVREALTRCLEDKEWEVREAAIKALWLVVGTDAPLREALLGRLGQGDDDTQAAVASVLGTLVESHQAVRDAFFQQLKSERPPARGLAVSMLANVVWLDPAAKQAVLEKLRDVDAEVRANAADALAAGIEIDAAVLAEFLGLQADDDASVRLPVVRALGTLAGSDYACRTALLGRIKDEDAWVRAATVEALGTAIGVDERVREALLGQLGDEDSDVRDAVVKALKTVAGSDGVVRKALLGQLSNESRQVRATAVRALAGAAEQDKKVREVLIEQLGDETVWVRKAAIEALGGMAETDGAVRTALLERLEGKYPEIRATVVEVLGVWAGRSKQVRDMLLTELKSQLLTVRFAALKALAVVVGTDREVQEALLERLKEESLSMRPAVVASLERAASEAAIQKALLAQLQGQPQGVKVAAVRALASVARHAPPVREALRECLADGEVEVRVIAARALMPTVASNSEVRESLLKLSRSEHPHDRAAAASALGAVPVDNAQVRGTLLDLLADGELSVRLSAVPALSTHVASDPAVRAKLLEQCRNQSSLMRGAVATALGPVSLNDGEAREALLGLTTDPEPQVRQAAVNALQLIAGSHEDVRKALFQRLGDEDTNVRGAAVSASIPLIKGELALQEEFLSWIEDKNPEKRMVVSALLAAVGRHDEIRAAILARLADVDPNVRVTAVGILRAWRKNDATVRQALLKSMEDSHFAVRVRAVGALAELSMDADADIERFIPWLGSVTDPRRSQHSEQARRSVAKLVAQHAARDERVVDTLLQMLRHPEWQTRRGAAMALLAMPMGPPPRAWQALLGLLDDLRDDGYWTERLTVATALINVADRKASQRAIDCAVRALDYGTEPRYHEGVTQGVRLRAVGCLGKLEPTYRNEQVLQRLLLLIGQDSRELVRDAAYTAAQRLIAAPVERSRVSASQSASKEETDRTASLLHLSDLHFSERGQAERWFGQLAEDLTGELQCRQLDGVILSGDITYQSRQEGFEEARFLLEKLREGFKLSPRQLVIVPGNHDLCWTASKKAYRLVRREEIDKLPPEGAYFEHNSEIIEVRDEGKYGQRFERFARFYEQVKEERYPLELDDQALLYHLPEVNLLVLGLNSSWKLDHHFTKRADINPTALARALERLRQEEKYRGCLKVAVWHHALSGEREEDYIKDQGFLELLSGAGFQLGLYGHIHRGRSDLYARGSARQLELIAAGTFGAPAHEWVPGYPLQYNLLQLRGRQLTVRSRRREEPNGAWKPDARWPTARGKDPTSFYTLELSEGE